MPAKTSNEINSHYNEVFRSGDLEGLVALYEPNAVLAPQPGHLVRGREAIREQLRSLLGLVGTLHAENQSCVEFENLALLRANWHFTGTDPGGDRVEIGGASAKVARRQPDGSWLYIMDLPWG
jgi:ketosteroid isomerase-like protein